MGRWHAEAVARTGHAVVAVADPDHARAAALAARFPGARTVTDLREVAGTVDVVHVCAPSPDHQRLAASAVDAGCHVLVEKPIAADAEGAATLLRAAAARGRLVVPVHQFLFQRGVLRVQRSPGLLGPLLHVDAIACTAGADRQPACGGDRLTLEIMHHLLSLVARLVSPSLTTADWHVRRTAPGELRADGTLAGTSVSLLVSTHGRPTTNALRLVGERGTAHVDLFHGFATIVRGPATRSFKVMHPFVLGGATLVAATANLASRAWAREPAFPGLRELVRRFYAAVEAGGPPPITGEETLEVARAAATIAGMARASAGASP
jgi:predicted dehydrogenase